MKPQLLVACLSAVLLASGCATVPLGPQPSAAEPAQSPAPAVRSAPAHEITPGAIEAHMRFLADDLLNGRLAGDPGYDIAALYLETQYRLMGLAPGGDDGFYQQVPLQRMRAVPEGAAMSIEGEALVAGEDFLVSAHAIHDESALEAEAVFVGYGIEAPSIGLSDFSGVDVEGRIAVVLYGAPGDLRSDVSAHLNSPRTRARYAAEAGAAGVIFIPAEGLTRWTFERMARASGRPRMTTEAATNSSELAVTASVSESTAERLFAQSGQSFTDIVEAARNGEALESFDLGVTVSLAQQTSREPVESANVLGVLPGSDPSVSDEPIIVTAHLDHLGECRLPEAEDSICNGALDNASGTAIMIETARAMAAGPAPRRPVVFVALAAEEQGLLGSAHLAFSPTASTAGAVANINLDMPVILYEFDDLLGFGSEHSNLGPIAEAAVARAGARLSPDPIPEQALFTRSDHYSFVRAGVPALFLMTGFSSPDEADDEGQGFLRFLGGNYHTPTDDFTQTIRFDQGAKFARINLEIIDAIANAEETPSWNEDSFFAR
ncbi:MAG: M28 family peptidase [Pseudomonadota bacterium]